MGLKPEPSCGFASVPLAPPVLFCATPVSCAMLRNKTPQPAFDGPARRLCPTRRNVKQGRRSLAEPAARRETGVFGVRFFSSTGCFLVAQSPASLCFPLGECFATCCAATIYDELVRIAIAPPVFGAIPNKSTSIFVSPMLTICYRAQSALQKIGPFDVGILYICIHR